MISSLVEISRSIREKGFRFEVGKRYRLTCSDANSYLAKLPGHRKGDEFVAIEVSQNGATHPLSSAVPGTCVKGDDGVWHLNYECEPIE